MNPTTTLLRELRTTSHEAVGLLAVEVLLHVAEKPRTYAELEHLTGASNGRISDVVNRFSVQLDKQTGQVVGPTLHLLTKQRRPEGRGFEVHMTQQGVKLCTSAAVACSAIRNQMGVVLRD